MFLNNRHYDPSTGVFVSVDPLVTMTGEPYIYGAANPVTISDPSGLCGCEDFSNTDWGNPGPSSTGGGSPSGGWLSVLPDRHLDILNGSYSTNPNDDPEGQIKIFDVWPAGPNYSRAAEVEACDWNPGQCATVKRAAEYLDALLPDKGDGTWNNARRHAALSAFYWLLAGNTDAMDAHENIINGELNGYLNGLRMMDLVNNEVGFDIARDLQATDAYWEILQTATPIGSEDPFLYSLGSTLPSIPIEMQQYIIDQTAINPRLVWLR